MINIKFEISLSSNIKSYNFEKIRWLNQHSTRRQITQYRIRNLSQLTTLSQSLI